MRAFTVILIYLIVGTISPVYSQIAHNNLQITNIANEGFLLTSSSKKVLIDALFTNGFGALAVPPKNILDEIMDAKAPFDSINLYLLTHYHFDHCDPVLIKNYLTKHKDIPFVTNKPAVVFIDGTCFGFIRLKKQFNVLTPEANQSISNTINNIPVKAFGFKHLSFYIDSINVEENMFNSSYLFEMDGIKIFHSGDIKKDAIQDYLAKNNKWTDTIDVAFLYFELFESGVPDLEYILNTLHPKHIIVMHVPLNLINEWAVKIDKLKETFPNITLFKNPMDSQTISIAGLPDK